ncbi:MAG: hypothetical protein ACRDOL_15190 [Streptosporangiaceae bacterium]
MTWRRAQMVLLSAQGMDVAAIAKGPSPARTGCGDVLRNFNADGFGSLCPRYKGGHPPKFTVGQRREIKKIAKAYESEELLQRLLAKYPNLLAGDQLAGSPRRWLLVKREAGVPGREAGGGRWSPVRRPGGGPDPGGGEAERGHEDPA